VYTKSKYIVGEIQDDMGSVITAIVFSDVISHIFVSKLFVPGTIIGAGFCYYDIEGVTVYGESFGLNIESNPEDEIHVGRAMGHPKYMQ
jgi:hypothetical protein